MLEADGVLWTWVLDVPLADRELTTNVERLADHRMAYLEYEGEVSNNRGTVSQVDRGTYTSTNRDTTGRRRLRATLCGGHLRGELNLVETSDPYWELTWSPAA